MSQYPSPAPGAVPAQPSTTGGYAPRKNTFGWVSLIAGAASQLLSFVATLVNAALYRSNAYEVAGISSAIFGVLSALLGIAALVFGIIGLLRKDAPKAAAAAGTALGAATLFGTLSTLIFQAVLSIGT